MSRMKWFVTNRALAPVLVVVALVVLHAAGVSLFSLGIISSLFLVFFHVLHGYIVSSCFMITACSIILYQLYEINGMMNIFAFGIAEKTAAAEVAASILLAFILAVVLRRQYDHIHMFYKKQTEENKEFLATFQHMEETTKKLRLRIQQAEAAQQLEEIMQKHDPAVILNDYIQLLHIQFHIQEVGMYEVDSAEKGMGLKAGTGALKRTIVGEDSPSFYQRLFQTKELVIQQADDGEGAPLLAVPICVSGVVVEVLVIRRMQAYRSHDAEFLHWLLVTFAKQYEAVLTAKEKLQEDTFFRTKVYRVDLFRELLHIERERERVFHQPFVCMGLYIKGLNAQKLPFVHDVLQTCLRKPDKVGFDEYTQVLYILFPAMEQKELFTIRKEIEAKFKKEKLTILNWTLLNDSVEI